MCLNVGMRLGLAPIWMDHTEDPRYTPDAELQGERTKVALREVLVHMIEEYARHCGHADLLRERIDGRVGQ
jgi:uncharacterized protein DUF664